MNNGGKFEHAKLSHGQHIEQIIEQATHEVALCTDEPGGAQKVLDILERIKNGFKVAIDQLKKNTMLKKAETARALLPEVHTDTTKTNQVLKEIEADYDRYLAERLYLTRTNMVKNLVAVGITEKTADDLIVAMIRSSIEEVK